MILPLGSRKPKALTAGDSIAVVSPSWGGPYEFPEIYELGLRNIREYLGLKIVEFPTARMHPAELYKSPQARANDINRAFADPEIKGIFATIGGDDSVRILPYLDVNVILNNPKILLGYSDTTTLLTYLNAQGLTTFHGPSIMAGMAQLAEYADEQLPHLRSLLFGEGVHPHSYRSFSHWSEGYPDWKDASLAGQVANKCVSQGGWKVLQGRTLVQGRLWGGCMDVLEMMKSTTFWPAPDFWKGRILFFETSEEGPSPTFVGTWLRNYGMQGIYAQVSALLFGRPRGYSEAQRDELHKTIIAVVAQEFSQEDLPILVDLDFGHTDPQFVIPLGALAEVDSQEGRFRLLESPTV